MTNANRMRQRHPLLIQAVQLSAAGRNAEAVLLINQLAAQDEPDGLTTLAEMKWRGGMVPQDVRAARELYRRAGERGDAGAAAIHTNLLASGIAGARDWAEALRRLRAEARSEPRRRRALDLIGAMKLTEEGDPVATPVGRMLSEAPAVTLFPGAFSAAECDYLRQLAEPLYQASVINDAQGRQVRDPIRTSDGATLHWLIEDPAVHALTRRLGTLAGVDAECGEALQILRYSGGQQYRPHLDFVRTTENQRHLTALIYLNHDYRGGETCFLKTGLKVKGRKGDALLFRNATPERQPDPQAEHAGLPVTSGTKYLASRWIRERRWTP